MRKELWAYGASAKQGDWPVMEDGFYVDPVQGVYALADGFGGVQAGDLAVAHALKKIREDNVHLAAEDVMQLINKHLLEWNAKRGHKGGCSLMLAERDWNTVKITHVGVCVALLLRAGRMHPILLPQAEPKLMRTFFLPEESLGTKTNFSFESRTLHLVPHDMLLLGTSGLGWDQEDFASTWISLRTEAQGNLMSLAERLVEKAKFWNVSVVLLECPGIM